MNLRLFFILLYLILPFFNNAQKLDIRSHADCTTRLLIETKKKVGPTTAPKDYGQDLEFKDNAPDDLHFMEAERHSVWYQFDSKTTGSMSFEIEPLDTLNDYDFALYKYTDEHFCIDVKNKTILPIRTNFSRNKTEIGSKTGLHQKASQAFISRGVNPAYSKAIAVEKGETYVLLVNNIYKNGSGHLLHFDYKSNRQLSTEPLKKTPSKSKQYVEEPTLIRWGGKIIDDNNQAVGGAHILLKDVKTQEVIAEGVSDSASGRYYLIFTAVEDQWVNPMHLKVQRKGYLFTDSLVNPYQLTRAFRHNPPTLALQSLAKGKRFRLFDILFINRTATPMTRSMPSIHALLETMQQNPQLKIKIEGHLSGCCPEPAHQAAAIQISNDRAKAIYQYLVDHGIAPERMTAIGYDCQYVLFNTTGPKSHLNRRIEIEVLDY